MSFRDDELDLLRRQFADRPAPESDQPLPGADRIWAAVRGELPAAEARALVEQSVTDPRLAEEWRLARELARELEADDADGRPTVAPVSRRRRVSSWRTGLAVAASLLLAVVGFQLVDDGPGPDPGPPQYRQGEAGTIDSLLADGAVLDRRQAVLRWSGPPGAVRYDLQVLTEDLREIAGVTDLEATEYRIPEANLADLPAGSGIYWRVVARSEDGSSTSATFEQRLE